MIDLSNIPADQRDELREQIKAEKQAAIEKRLAKVKLDEETQAKLAELETYKTKEAEAQEAAALEEAETKAADLLAKSKVNVDMFKDMKDYDKFLAIEKDEDRDSFITKLKESKPYLFTPAKRNALSLSNAEIYSDKKPEEQIKVY